MSAYPRDPQDAVELEQRRRDADQGELTDVFLAHVVTAPSQYDGLVRQMAAEILRLRAEKAVLVDVTQRTASVADGTLTTALQELTTAKATHARIAAVVYAFADAATMPGSWCRQCGSIAKVAGPVTHTDACIVWRLLKALA